MYGNKILLQREGIFRKSPAQSNEQKLEQYLSKHQYDKIKDVDDDYAVAGLLKKIYDKMKTPIFPY